MRLEDHMIKTKPQNSMRKSNVGKLAWRRFNKLVYIHIHMLVPKPCSLKFQCYCDQLSEGPVIHLHWSAETGSPPYVRHLWQQNWGAIFLFLHPRLFEDLFLCPKLTFETLDSGEKRLQCSSAWSHKVLGILKAHSNSKTNSWGQQTAGWECVKINSPVNDFQETRHSEPVA